MIYSNEEVPANISINFNGPCLYNRIGFCCGKPTGPDPNKTLFIIFHPVKIQSYHRIFLEDLKDLG